MSQVLGNIVNTLFFRVANNSIVKIGDFGQAKETYFKDYYRKSGEGTEYVPVRWLAPESLTEGVFSIRSDVVSSNGLLNAVPSWPGLR